MTESKPIDILPKKEVPETPQEESVEKTEGKSEEKKPDEFQRAKGDVAERVRQAARGTPEIGKKLSDPSARTGSSVESLFESKLREVMSEGEKAVPLLSKGKKAAFAPKTEAAWRTFFANVSLRGSREQPATRDPRSIASALFRGVFQSEAQQKGGTLVTDLKFKADGREVTEKFARLILEEPAVREVEKLLPGESLATEQLPKGGELTYTVLAPVTEQGNEKGGAELLKQLRSDLNPMATARLERSLFEERLRKAADSPAEFLKAMTLLADEKERREGRKFPFPFWYSGPRERETRLGKPRLGILVSFGIGLSIAALIAYLIWRNLS